MSQDREIKGTIHESLGDVPIKSLRAVREILYTSLES